MGDCGQLETRPGMPDANLDEIRRQVWQFHHCAPSEQGSSAADGSPQGGAANPEGSSDSAIQARSIVPPTLPDSGVGKNVPGYAESLEDARMKIRKHEADSWEGLRQFLSGVYGVVTDTKIGRWIEKPNAVEAQELDDLKQQLSSAAYKFTAGGKTAISKEIAAIEEGIKVRGARLGLASAAFVIGGDYLVDRWLFPQDHVANWERSTTVLADLVGQPLALMITPGGWAVKAAAMIGVHALGRYFDHGRNSDNISHQAIYGKPFDPNGPVDNVPLSRRPHGFQQNNALSVPQSGVSGGEFHIKHETIGLPYATPEMLEEDRQIREQNALRQQQNQIRARIEHWQSLQRFENQ